MNLINILYYSKRALKFSLFIVIIYSIIYLLKTKKTKSSFFIKDFIIKIIYVGYVSALVQITIIRDWNNFFNISNLNYSINMIQYIPFYTIVESYHLGRWQLIYHVLGNMLWFLPFGFISPVIIKNITNIKKIIILSFIFSFSIELLQFLLNSGISDIDDIILNILGSILGYNIYKLFMLLKSNYN